MPYSHSFEDHAFAHAQFTCFRPDGPLPALNLEALRLRKCDLEIRVYRLQYHAHPLVSNALPKPCTKQYSWEPALGEDGSLP